ncbi:hypothetical protein GCM10010210_00600 [Pseudonocardia hydrocarbonoxydans]|uniref:Uncharacterized protein n=2 Tax=Pseudonocardia hydrocarbonoxydans TaxID=76726 RepID=A0A4Y3WMA2_9PSEU|nr:hypothetical protein PHY01_12720 [Pseudonocardia hydrocarbonoxydans]
MMDGAAAHRIAALCDVARAALADGRDDEARAAFTEATALSAALPAPHPQRLTLAGEHADAWFERWNDTERALVIAGAAYDEAVETFEEAAGEQRGESVRALGRLRDRMTFFAFSMDDAG